MNGAPLDLVRRVDLSPDEIVIHLNLSRLLGGREAALRYAIPTRIRRRGLEMRLVVDAASKGSGTARRDPALIKAVARAHEWFEDLVTGRARSYSAIAKREGITDRYVAHLMPLAFLAPEIVAAILEGAQPVELSAEMLTKRSDLPLGWAEHRALLGFD